MLVKTCAFTAMEDFIVVLFHKKGEKKAKKKKKQKTALPHPIQISRMLKKVQITIINARNMDSTS